MVEWRFPSNDYGENKGINDSGVAMFRGTPLTSLAREICQNSLDAAIKDKTIVEFNMFKVPSTELPGRDVMLDTFQRCLQFWGGQKAQATKDFYNAAIEEISKDECTFLRISDFNTKGLMGSREEINTDWTNLTKSSGASDKKGTAGGSYGIGKFAPFACSYFSTVFYSTYDMQEERASQGVARLVTFTREDGQNTQGTGYYGGERNTPVYEELNLDPNFSRQNKEYGTDIYIAGYKYGGDNWKKDIIVSILNGFLGAIWNEKLEVRIGDVVINKQELEPIIDTYRDDLTGYTDKYYRVLTSNETVWSVDDFLGMGEIKLGLLLGDQDSPNRISMIRQTGMKIMDKDRLPGHVPITGVMFINGDKINERLRLIENPEHTKWEPERSKNPIQERQLLKSLNEYIKNKIEELVSSGASESIDAIGVGNFLPDDLDDAEDKKKEEVISDKVLEVEVKKIKRKSSSQSTQGVEETIGEDTEPGHAEEGGDGEEWFHTGGKTEEPGYRPAQEAHLEESGDRDVPVRINVGMEKFVSICVNKDEGKYVLLVVPNRDGENGIIELFLSAETQNYEAPIKKASLIGGSMEWENNVCRGLTFCKGQPLRISLELDYSDYCSMEVTMYADKK